MTPETRAVRPLTKETRDGRVLKRRPEVESQIAAIEELGRFDPGRLGNRERGSAGYVYDETIVYLIRSARDSGDFGLIELLYVELDRRTNLVTRKFRNGFGVPQAEFEDFQQNVAMAILTKMLDTVGDSSDYMQVNFGDYVVMAANSEARRYRRGDFRHLIFFEDMNRDEDAVPFEDTIADGRPDAERQLIAAQMIGTLPEELIHLATLYYLDGWQIESKDDGLMTLSKLYGVDPRTIRNRLGRARKILEENAR